jgi:hypothetical protein
VAVPGWADAGALTHHLLVTIERTLLLRPLPKVMSAATGESSVLELSDLRGVACGGIAAKAHFITAGSGDLIATHEKGVAVVQCIACASLCGSLEAFLAHGAQPSRVTVPFVESTCCRVCHAEQPPNAMGLYLRRRHDAQVYNLLDAKTGTVTQAWESMQTGVKDMGWLTEELCGVVDGFKRSAFPDAASSSFEAVTKAAQVLASMPTFWEGANFAAHENGTRDRYYSSQMDLLGKARQRVTEHMAALTARLQSLPAVPVPAAGLPGVPIHSEAAGMNAELYRLSDDKGDIDTRLQALRTEELAIKKAYQVLLDHKCVTVDAVHALFDAEEDHVRALFTDLYRNMDDMTQIQETLSKPPQHASQAHPGNSDSMAGAFKSRGAHHELARYRIKLQLASERIMELQAAGFRRAAPMADEDGPRSKGQDKPAIPASAEEEFLLRQRPWPRATANATKTHCLQTALPVSAQGSGRLTHLFFFVSTFFREHLFLSSTVFLSSTFFFSSTFSVLFVLSKASTHDAENQTSSKTCCECHSLMQSIGRAPSGKPLRETQCSNQACPRSKLDNGRDIINAAINIKLVLDKFLAGRSRPAYLCRGPQSSFFCCLHFELVTCIVLLLLIAYPGMDVVFALVRLLSSGKKDAHTLPLAVFVTTGKDANKQTELKRFL